MMNQMRKDQLKERCRKNKMESPTVHLGGKYVTRMVFAVPL